MDTNNQQQIALKYTGKLFGEMVASLETIAQYAAMPASNQQAHPISEDEFRQRLLAIGNEARSAIRRIK